MIDCAGSNAGEDYIAKKSSSTLVDPTSCGTAGAEARLITLQRLVRLQLPQPFADVVFNGSTSVFQTVRCRFESGYPLDSIPYFEVGYSK